MEAMERLGFLQLAKRFLLLGKGEANNTPSAEDSRFIQPRPPAGRTLSLKIFNRVSASTEQLEQNEAVSDLRNDRLPRSEVTKGHKKKFHSYKEGAASRARKENADPRLRIASVGRKHVWRTTTTTAEEIRGIPPRTLVYQEYTTKVAQIPGINIMADLSSPTTRESAGENPRNGRLSHNNNNNNNNNNDGKMAHPPEDSTDSKRDDTPGDVANRNLPLEQSGDSQLISPSQVERDIFLLLIQTSSANLVVVHIFKI